MATFASALQRVKDDLQVHLPSATIEQACQEAGHRWRKRKLDPVTTIQLFVLQILWGNTAIVHLRHLAHMPLNAAAYCKARMRLPLAALEKLLGTLACNIAGVVEPRRWCGLRVLLVDATCALAPDTPDNQKQFPQPKGQKKGCGFPVPKLLGLVDAFSGLIVKALFTPLYQHDLRGSVALHAALGQGDLLCGDRAFCAYAHFHLLTARQVLGLFRMHASRRVDFQRPGRRRQRQAKPGQARSQCVRSLGDQDQLVKWFKPRACHCPKWMTPAQYHSVPESMLIRELRFEIPTAHGRTRVVIIATTLLDPVLYPKALIAELYGLRWTIETHFGELKTTLKMRRIKCQTAAGVQKELLIFCLVYNLTHAVVLQAAQRQHTPPERLSFIDALRWLLTAAPGEPIPHLRVNPCRKGRHQPRVVKDRRDGYQRMTRTRSHMNKNPAYWPGRK
jgi:hypothetical protein